MKRWQNAVGTPHERSVSVPDGGRSSEVRGGGGRDENADGHTMDGGNPASPPPPPPRTFPKRHHTAHVYRSYCALPAFLLRYASVRWHSLTVLLCLRRPSADLNVPVPSSLTEYQSCTVLWGGIILGRSLWATPHLLTWAQPTWNKLKVLKNMKNL